VPAKLRCCDGACYAIPEECDRRIDQTCEVLANRPPANEVNCRSSVHQFGNLIALSRDFDDVLGVEIHLHQVQRPGSGCSCRCHDIAGALDPGAAALAMVISTVSHNPEAIAAAASRTWIMTEQPPTAMPSTYLGVMPRYCAMVARAVASPSMSAGSFPVTRC
jgi:hypothetical protein